MSAAGETEEQEKAVCHAHRVGVCACVGLHIFGSGLISGLHLRFAAWVGTITKYLLCCCCSNQGAQYSMHHWTGCRACTCPYAQSFMVFGGQSLSDILHHSFHIIKAMVQNLTAPRCAVKPVTECSHFEHFFQWL